MTTSTEETMNQGPRASRRPRRAFTTAAILAAGLASAGCGGASSAYNYVSPSTVEEVSDDLWQVTLTEQAAQRTGIETTEVATTTVDGAERLTVPYSAVMYHYDGTTWTYTSPEPLTYLRAPIEIDRIEGDVAILLDGPPVGTTVVTVGAAELYGVEFGIGK